MIFEYHDTEYHDLQVMILEHHDPEYSSKGSASEYTEQAPALGSSLI
jgi:hypothetical protein